MFNLPPSLTSLALGSGPLDCRWLSRQAQLHRLELLPCICSADVLGSAVGALRQLTHLAFFCMPPPYSGPPGGLADGEQRKEHEGKKGSALGGCRRGPPATCAQQAGVAAMRGPGWRSRKRVPAGTVPARCATCTGGSIRRLGRTWRYALVGKTSGLVHRWRAMLQDRKEERNDKGRGRAQAGSVADRQGCGSAPLCRCFLSRQAGGSASRRACSLCTWHAARLGAAERPPCFNAWRCAAPPPPVDTQHAAHHHNRDERVAALGGDEKRRGGGRGAGG